MLKTVLKYLRSTAAVLVGYAVIVAGTTLGFTYWLGGGGFYTSTPFVLAMASGVAAVSGFCGGYVAAWLGNTSPFLHAAGVLLPLAVDSTFVLTSGISKDPVWFDLMGALTLMLFTLVGGGLVWIRNRQRLYRA